MRSGRIGLGLGNGVPGSGVPGPTGDGSGVGGGSSGTGGRSGRSGSGSVGTGGPCGSVGSGSGKGFGCGGSGIVMWVLPAPCVAAWRQRRPTRSVPGERPHTTTKVSPAQTGPGVSTPKPGVPTGRVHEPTSRPTRPDESTARLEVPMSTPGRFDPEQSPLPPSAPVGQPPAPPIPDQYTEPVAV